MGACALCACGLDITTGAVNPAKCWVCRIVRVTIGDNPKHLQFLYFQEQMVKNGLKDLHVFVATQSTKWQGFQGDSAKYWDLFLFICFTQKPLCTWF